MVIVGNHAKATPPLLRNLCALCVKIPILPPSQPSQENASAPTKSRRIRTYEKRARNPFTICTSKTQDLKSFRIRTYKKTREGEGPSPPIFLRAQKQLRNIQVLPLSAFPFGNALVENGGVTRVKTLGR